MNMHIEGVRSSLADDCTESFKHFLNTKNRKEFKKATKPRIGWSRIPKFVPDRVQFDIEYQDHPEYGLVEVKVYNGLRAHMPSLF